MLYTNNDTKDITTSFLCSTIKNRLIYGTYLPKEERDNSKPESYNYLQFLQNRQAPTQHFMTSLKRAPSTKDNQNYLLEYINALPFEKIIHQETSLLNSHVPLYSACSKKVYLIQTFTKQLISLAKNDISLKRPLHDITWFRNPLAKMPKNIIPDVSSYLSLYGENILDNKVSTAWNLISCNPHLFGNTLSDAMESTLDYWWDDNNVTAPSLEDIVNESFQSLNLYPKNFRKQEHLIKKLEKTVDLIQAKHGVLFQIFIPHEEVNEITYISKANGVQDETHPDALKSLLDIQYKKTDEIINYKTMQVRLLTGRFINPDHTADYRIHTYYNFSAQQNEQFHFDIACIIQELLKNCTTNVALNHED
ncbi:MAG: hypothetical protein ACRCU0_03830 [Candidatus Rhabdochlamydia sp.]